MTAQGIHKRMLLKLLFFQFGESDRSKHEITPTRNDSKCDLTSSTVVSGTKRFTLRPISELHL